MVGGRGWEGAGEVGRREVLGGLSPRWKEGGPSEAAEERGGSCGQVTAGR